MAFVWPGQGRAAVSSAIAGADLRGASAALRPLFVRTTKRELGLPPVDVTVRRLDLPPLHRELYRALVGQAAVQSRGYRDIEALGRVLLYLLMAATSPALLATGATRHEPLPYRVPPLDPPEDSTLAELLRDLPLYELSPKYKEAAALVATNAGDGRKTLIWSTFVRNLTSLAALLDGFNPAVIHGGTDDRDEQLRRFRSDSSCFVLLSNPATLGEGVSLHHECHDAVYVDRDFAAGRFLQSLDRIHRLGLAPDTETRVTLLLASETIDELVEQRLAAKLEFMGGILDDPEVSALADLAEEPSSSVGMDSSDVAALLAYLNSSASA
jgi:SNF2 family DNA or RNA helicase